jgi:hypothetical protein
MTRIKWINTSLFKNEIENLVANNEIIFIEVEYYSVLTQLVDTIQNLYPNYTTNLFNANWSNSNYNDTYNLTFIKNELTKNPNNRYYLEIHPKQQYYTLCNDWVMYQTLENKKNDTTLATTLSYAHPNVTLSYSY